MKHFKTAKKYNGVLDREIQGRERVRERRLKKFKTKSNGLDFIDKSVNKVQNCNPKKAKEELREKERKDDRR